MEGRADAGRGYEVVRIVRVINPNQEFWLTFRTSWQRYLLDYRGPVLV